MEEHDPALFLSPQSPCRTGLHLSQGGKVVSTLGKWGEADFLENRETFKFFLSVFLAEESSGVEAASEAQSLSF